MSKQLQHFRAFFLTQERDWGIINRGGQFLSYILENGEFMSIQRFKLAAFSAFAAVLLGVFHQANASVVYSYVAQQSTYNAQPGASVTVNVYLQELLTGNSTSFIASDGGLSGFVAVVNRVPGTLPPMPSILSAAAANTTDFQLFNSATYNFVAGTGDSGQVQGSADTGGVTGTAHPGAEVGNGAVAVAKSNAIYLGNFTVTAGSGPGTTQFTLGAIDPVNGGATTTTFNVFDLDLAPDASGAPAGAFTPVGTTLTTFNVTVAGVPEPASLGLLAFGGLLALRRRRA
jgi:hypothetical protein